MTPSWDKYRGRIIGAGKEIRVGDMGRRVMTVLSERLGDPVERDMIAALAGMTVAQVDDAARVIRRQLRAAFGGDDALVETRAALQWMGGLGHATRPLVNAVAAAGVGMGYEAGVHTLLAGGFRRVWSGKAAGRDVGIWQRADGAWQMLARMPDGGASIVAGGRGDEGLGAGNG